MDLTADVFEIFLCNTRFMPLSVFGRGTERGHSLEWPVLFTKGLHYSRSENEGIPYHILRYCLYSTAAATTRFSSSSVSVRVQTHATASSVAPNFLSPPPQYPRCEDAAMQPHPNIDCNKKWTRACLNPMNSSVYHQRYACMTSWVVGCY